MPSPGTSIISRSEASSLGLKRYFTGQPCPKGHVSPRATASGTCCECKRLSALSWHQKNKQQQRDYGKAYRAARGEDLLQKKREYQAEWMARNLEEKKRRDALYEKQKRSARDASFMASAALRSAKYLRSLDRATPSWCDGDAVRGMYELASVFRSIGLGVEVDHIVPLQGKTVSGLHTADNLQLLLRSANASKSNRAWPDMP